MDYVVPELHPGTLSIRVGVGAATAAGIASREVLAELVHRGYLSTSGVERLVSQAYDIIDRSMRMGGGGATQPPLVVLNAPPGVGKTYTLLRFMEAVRTRGDVLGVKTPYAYYLAPYLRILEDVRLAYRKIVDGYDPIHGRPEPVYLLYRSPRDCPFARRYRDLIERWGSEEIACQLCPLRARISVTSDHRSLYKLMYRAIVVEQRAVDTPILDVLPQTDGQVCLRNIAVQLALLLPSLRSRRRSLIAGLVGSFNSVLNPAYMKVWDSVRKSDTPKLLLFDEFDMLILSPVVVSTEAPLDLYPSEKEVLASTIGVKTYYDIVNAFIRLYEEPWTLEGSTAYRVAPILRRLTPEAVDEICRRCRSMVLERGEYCRLCNPLRTLSFLSWLVLRAVDKGCDPVNVVLAGAYRVECYNYGFILWAERRDSYATIEARPVWWTLRLLLDPFYPSTTVKVLASATADIIYAPRELGALLDEALTSIKYGMAITVDSTAKYDRLDVYIVDVDSSVMNVLAMHESRGYDIFSSVMEGGGGEGLETSIIVHAPVYTCSLLALTAEFLASGERALVFANSKLNAMLMARLLVEYLRSLNEAPLFGKTDDYILVSWRSREVYVSWYRSRISRGVSTFKDARVAAILLYQRDPPLENEPVHHARREAFGTVQSLFRIIRSLRPGRKAFVMPFFVWDFLVKNGPSWLPDAPSNVWRYRLDSPEYRTVYERCEAIGGRLRSAIREVYERQGQIF